jgi:hypothetical protein
MKRMLYGPDGAWVVADDPCAAAVACRCAVAADATANGFVPIDAASAPAPIALTASLRATSTSECFVFVMVDGTPFPGDLQMRAIPRVARDRTATGGIGHEARRRSASRADAACRALSCTSAPGRKAIRQFCAFPGRAATQCAIGATDGHVSGQAVKPLS